MAVQRQAITSAYIESGRVLDVDIENYTVTIATQYTKKPQSGISFATPYQHFANGEGIYFMPEVGSLCWVCFPSDGSRAFVLAWAAARDDYGFRALKKDLNPGDIYLGTRDENFIVLRRGGVVQIGGGPLCQRMFLPVNNIIRDFCENYALHSAAGSFEWSIKRDEMTTDGKRPAHVVLEAREFANDEQAIAALEIGSHDGDGHTILSLNINESGAVGAERKVTLQIGKSGKTFFKVEDSVDIVVNKGDYTLNAVEGNINLTAKKKAAATAAAIELLATEMNVTVTALKGVIELIAASKVTVAPMLEVAGGTTPVMLATPQVLAYILTHTHDFVGVAPGSAAVTLMPSAGSTAALADNAHVSKKSFSA